MPERTRRQLKHAAAFWAVFALVAGLGLCAAGALWLKAQPTLLVQTP